MTHTHIQTDQYAYQMARKTGRPSYSGEDHTFVFSPEDIEGRSADFVAPILVPKLSEMISNLAAQAPRHLWVGRSLGAPDYDHASSTLRFNCCYQRDTRMPGRFELLNPFSSFDQGANLRRPDTANNSGAVADPRLTQRARYEMAVNNNDDKSPSKLEVTGRNLLAGATLPSTALALDRVLEIDGIPLSPDRMEAVMVRLGHGSIYGIHSRIYFSVESVARGPGNRALVMFAHLESVDILDPDDKPIVTLAPERFPQAADRWTATTQAAVAEREAAAKAASEKAELEAKKVTEAAGTAANAHDRAVASVDAAAQAALRGPYGPDVVGLRLGMTFQEADAILRNHMAVGWVLSHGPTPLDLADPKLTSSRTYVNKDRSEVVVLIDMPPDGAGRVMAIKRGFKVSVGTGEAQVEAALISKYGPPAHKEAQPAPIWTWGASDSPCIVPVEGMVSEHSVVIEGQPADNPDYLNTISGSYGPGIRVA